MKPSRVLDVPNSDVLKRLLYDIGGMWDDSEWEIQTNYKLSLGYGVLPCKHCKPGGIDGCNRVFVICPRVVSAENEGGFNSTGVCLDCILEAAKELEDASE